MVSDGFIVVVVVVVVVVCLFLFVLFCFCEVVVTKQPPSQTLFLARHAIFPLVGKERLSVEPKDRLRRRLGH